MEAIRDYPAPTNIKEVQRFLGLAGWYHRFVPNFSRIAEPINALKKKGCSFLWSQQCQQAFEHLKCCLTSPPILGHPDLQLPFTVYTDASDTGLGAVLTQRKGTGIGTSYCLCQQNPEQSRDQLLSHRKRVFGRNLGPGEMAALPRAQTFHCHHGPLSATMGNVFHKNHESPHPMGLPTSEI